MKEISSRIAPIIQTDKARQGDIVVYWTDNRKAEQQLGWKPTDGLADRLHTNFRVDSRKRGRVALALCFLTMRSGKAISFGNLPLK